MLSIFRKKNFSEGLKSHDELLDLKRHLGARELTYLGIGAIIGGAIFIIAGQAAAFYAGPAIILSFIFACLLAILAGLSYAELAALLPGSTGAYTYAYYTLGELPAWMTGWIIASQTLIGVSTIAVGWGGYFVDLLLECGISFPAFVAQTPFTFQNDTGWQWTGSYLNLPAALLVLFIAAILIHGVKTTTYLNRFLVIVKLSIIAIFILIGIFFVTPAHWTPFIPPNSGSFGHFGWSGIFRGAGLVFFVYVGLETIATLTRETIRPQRNLPIGMLSSIGVSTLIYILFALVLTGVTSYHLLGIPNPISAALDVFGPHFFWLSFAVKLAILAGLASIVLVHLLAQSRALFMISKDGLLPPFMSQLHHKESSPLGSIIVASSIAFLFALFLPVSILAQLVSLSSLLLFSIVSLCVILLRYRHPKTPRPFKIPFFPYLPLLSITAFIGQTLFFPKVTWLQFLGWLFLGLLLYFCYGKKHSRKKSSSPA